MPDKVDVLSFENLKLKSHSSIENLAQLTRKINQMRVNREADAHLEL